MARCKATTSKGTQCKNSAEPGSDYCHIPSHCHHNTGNDYWTFREKHGRDPIYESPEELWEHCKEYFEWVRDNPLEEQKAFHSAGLITKTTLKKMRAMTIKGLCLFLGICEKTWANYRNRDDFLQVVTRAESIIYTQKLEGAAADLLNPNIIARDLGLKNKQEIDHTHDINYSELSNEQLQRIIDGEDPSDVIGDS